MQCVLQQNMSSRDAIVYLVECSKYQALNNTPAFCSIKYIGLNNANPTVDMHSIVSMPRSFSISTHHSLWKLLIHENNYNKMNYEYAGTVTTTANSNWHHTRGPSLTGVQTHLWNMNPIRWLSQTRCRTFRHSFRHESHTRTNLMNETFRFPIIRHVRFPTEFVDQTPHNRGCDQMCRVRNQRIPARRTM